MLYDWCHHFGAQIFHVAALNGCAPSGLPPAQLARALLARPDVDPGGRTYLEIGKPVINCNTQSYEDAEKYNLAMEQHALSALMEAKRLQGDDGLSPEASVEDAIFFGLGDGAAFNLEEGHVKHKPIRWRNWISLKGPFHSEAHQHFASHETFGPALTIWAANVLERDIDTSQPSCLPSPSPHPALAHRQPSPRRALAEPSGLTSSCCSVVQCVKPWTRESTFCTANLQPSSLSGSTASSY